MSSSRTLFGTDGIRGPANVEPLTPETALRIGQVAAAVLLERAGEAGQWPVCVLGRDTRLSGPMLEAAVAAGLASTGVDVRLAGVVPTPAVAYLTKKVGAAMGVVISASHNPFQDNGIKFFGRDGYKLDDALEEAIERLLAGTDTGWTPPRAGAGMVGRIDVLEGAEDAYVHRVLSTVRTDARFLDGVRVALDCAHGAAFRTSPHILAHLGADVVTRYDQPTGRNINEGCGATHPEAIAALVRESRAVVGIAHDGDADRVVLCDETGSPLDGDEILAIAATHLARKGRLAENSVVATVMSNHGLDDTVKALGGAVVRCGVGDRQVIEAMRQRGLNLGGEQSGHIIFHDHTTTGDGIVAAVQILEIMAAEDKPLSELRRCLVKFPQVLRSLPVRSKPPLEALREAGRLIAETEAALAGRGRVLLRYSGTEPKIRLLLEGPDAVYVETRADLIASAIRDQIGA
jgi:phosphoglucosamine mutase